MLTPLVLQTEQGALDGAYQSPDGDVRALYVLAHGAGAGFAHKNMTALAAAFAGVGVASLRFNFPFMQQQKRRVDAQPVALATLSAAVAWAQAHAPDVPLLLGGHSFGGRMASHWLAASADTAAVRAGVFCSFPLHPAGKPGTSRAAHLGGIEQPLLFLSGTRDALAQQDLLESTVAALPQATLHWLQTADHSYQVLKRTRDPALGPVFEEMAACLAGFLDSL